MNNHSLLTIFQFHSYRPKSQSATTIPMSQRETPKTKTSVRFIKVSSAKSSATKRNF